VSFLQAEKRRQTEWKLTTTSISPAARRPGLIGNRLHPFCLPVDHATENLFPAIRTGLLEYFGTHNITWHKAAIPGYPSNHLCSSQVFLVNLLGPFQRDREGMLVIAGHLLPETEKVLPIEQLGQYLAFEWVPPVDLLRELSPKRRKLTRGVGNTSMDFAFLARTETNRTVLVLGESKYTEHYPRGPVDQIRASKRLERLGPVVAELSWLRAGCDTDRRYLATEPVFQLLRHHIMVHRLRETFPKVDDVVLVHLFVDRPHSGVPASSPVLDGHPGLQLLANSPITFVQMSAQNLFHSIAERLPPAYATWREYIKERYRL
jgi:hypothetical protein